METENITMVEDMEADTGDGLNMTEMVDNIAVIFFSLEYFMRETSESDVWMMIWNNLFERKLSHKLAIIDNFLKDQGGK